MFMKKSVQKKLIASFLALTLVFALTPANVNYAEAAPSPAKEQTQKTITHTKKATKKQNIKVAAEKVAAAGLTLAAAGAGYLFYLMQKTSIINIFKPKSVKKQSNTYSTSRSEQNQNKNQSQSTSSEESINGDSDTLPDNQDETIRNMFVKPDHISNEQENFTFSPICPMQEQDDFYSLFNKPGNESFTHIVQFGYKQKAQQYGMDIDKGSKKSKSTFVKGYVVGATVFIVVLAQVGGRIFVGSKMDNEIIPSQEELSKWNTCQIISAITMSLDCCFMIFYDFFY